MKKIILFTLLSFVFVTVGFSQSVKITGKTTTYKRPKPIVDFKKTFTVKRPIVSGVSPSLKKKIETTISFEKNLGLNIQDEKTENQWLEETDFVVNYNQNGLLDIQLTMSGTAAYPSIVAQNLVVDLKTGKLVAIKDVFVNLSGLAVKIKKKQTTEIEKAKAEIKKEPDYQDIDADELFGEKTFTVEDLKEFSISDKGVTFLYDYGFPHVVLALQPEGKYFFTWKELKDFVKPSGLLGKFIK